MAKSRRRREYTLTRAVERVQKDVTSILARRQSSRYFEGIVLMYSLIENVVKWLVFLKIVWNKSDRVLSVPERESLKQFCNRQDFNGALNLALVTGLFTHRLFRQIDRIRGERNDLLHQFYLFTHRRNSRVLRAKLARLVRLAVKMFRVLNALVADTGVADTYPAYFTVRRRKELLI
jgi:hypothetical protein